MDKEKLSLTIDVWLSRATVNNVRDVLAKHKIERTQPEFAALVSEILKRKGFSIINAVAVEECIEQWIRENAK